jgi:hypothetical protein
MLAVVDPHQAQQVLDTIDLGLTLGRLGGRPSDQKASAVNLDPTKLPTPKTELDVATFAVMDSAVQEMAAAANAAAATVMGRVGDGRRLPPLTWTYKPDLQSLNGLASDGDYEPAEALQALARWASALGLTRLDTPPVGTVEYSGMTVFKVQVTVWTVTDREAWETANRSEG